MNLIDRLLDRVFDGPTLENLFRHSRRWLNEQGCTELEFIPQRMEIRIDQRDRQQTIYVGNLLREYQRAPRSQRPSLLHKFLASVPADQPSPDAYLAAKRQLMPVVRSRAALGIYQQSSAKPDSSANSQLAFRSLAADLTIALVLDSPDSMSYVPEHSLTQWGVTWEQAFQDALDNLRGLPEHGGWQEVAPGVWSGEWGDSYESSRILLPDLVYRLGISEPVVMVPFRHTLLVTSAANAQGLEAMVGIVHEALENQGRWLSFELFRLEESKWTHFTASGKAAAMQATLRIRREIDFYESQRQVLEGQFQEKDVDIFVASCTLIQLEGEPMTSYAVWSEHVDTLLPQAESVVLRYGEGDGGWHTRLPWTTVVEQFGHLMEPTDYVPKRFRVRSFPERSALHQIAASSAL